MEKLITNGKGEYSKAENKSTLRYRVYQIMENRKYNAPLSKSKESI